MSNINEFQKMCAKFVNDIDNKYNIKRDPHFCFTQLMEEIGELAKEINKPRLRSQEIDQKNLKGEFADVFLQLSALAGLLDVNLEEAVKEKIEEIKKRHNL